MPTDPISERVVASVVTALKQVKTAGGYAYTLASVERITGQDASGGVQPLSAIVFQQDDPDGKPDAPFGQIEWADLIEVMVWIQMGGTDATPIGRVTNLLVADLTRALMADPRRGGLCYVDNEIKAVLRKEDTKSKISEVRLFLGCRYRTLRGDPTRLAPTATNELFFQGGATLYIAPRLNPQMAGPWKDYADVRVMPKLDPQTETIYDDATGISRPITERYTRHALRYTVEADYLNADAIMRHVGGATVTTADQSGGTYAAVPHLVVAADSLVPLVDAQQQPVLGVTAVASVTNSAATTTYAAGTDYIADPAFLRDGMLKIPPASTIPAKTQVLITFSAPSQSRPAIVAGTACAAEVRARIVWTASDGVQMTHFDFDGSLLATNAGAAPGGPTTTTLTLTVLDDGSDTPLGRYLMPAGPKPTVGY